MIEKFSQHPFSHIKMRYLLAWFLLGSTLFLSIPDVVAFIVPSFRVHETMFEIISILFYGSVILFCKELLDRNGIPFKRIFGKLPSLKTAIGPMGLTVPVYFFSLLSLVFFAALVGILFPLKSNIFLAEDLELLQTVHPLAAFIGTVIAAPVAEEIFFRGLLLHRWAEKWGFKKAFVITSIFFGILHFQNAISITLFALILGILYVRTGSLYLTILCHAVYNFFSFLQEQIAAMPYDTSQETSLESLFTWDMVVISGIGVVFLGWFLINYIVRHWPQGDIRLPYEKNIEQI